MADEPTLAEQPAGDTTPTDTKTPTEYVTLAEDEEDPEEDGEDSEGDESSEPDASDDGAHKRKSGAARAKERIQRLERELAEERRARTSRPEPAQEASDDDLKEPKESDFDNWIAYQRALNQYDARKAIRDENKRTAERQTTGQKQREQEERIRTYRNNLDQVRDRVPDFDRILADARDRPVTDTTQELILESPKGPLLAYYLAKNPDKLADLNRMSPTAAARELGRLEARIRIPQPKAKTNATPPPKTPRGGGGAAPSRDPATMTMAQYNEWRDKGGGK